MRLTLRSTAKYILIFFCTFFLLFVLIPGAASIPKTWIKSKMLESAEYMSNHKTSFLITDWISASQIDHYADCINLSIADQLDEEKPLQSAMWTVYYDSTSEEANESFLNSVRYDLPGNTEYLRYWHGSAAMMRFLHLILNVKQIYFLHAVLMAVLILILVLLLMKNGYKAEAISFALSMIVVSIWYVPFCLEYTYSFLCMLIASIAGTLLALNRRDKWIGSFFLIVGMATVYFDFLTTETLSLLIPLLLLCRIKRAEKSRKNQWIDSIRWSIAWGIGYIGMWMMKWVLASVVLSRDVMPYVTGHISARLDGEVSGGSITGNLYIDTLLRNMRKLFPYEYGISGAILVVVFIFLVFFLPAVKGRICIGRKIKMSKIFLYIVIGLIPFVRFLVLSNHSYIHSIFTYRALASTILALCFIILELVEPVRSPTPYRKAVNTHGSDNSHALPE